MMSLTYEYINRLAQFGTVQYDLCINDGATLIARMQKTFPENVTDDEMSIYALEQVARFEAALTPPVPTQVSPRQICHALNMVGLRDAVEYAVAQSDQYVKDWWNRSTVFERHNPQVIAMAVALGVSDAQVDDLWRLADSL